MSHFVVSAVGIGVVGAAVSQASTPILLRLGGQAVNSAVRNSVAYGQQYLMEKAKAEEVTLLNQVRNVRKFKFHLVTDNDLIDMETRTCIAVLVCSVPLGGIAGFVNAGRHFISIFISATGCKKIVDLEGKSFISLHMPLILD